MRLTLAPARDVAAAVRGAGAASIVVVLEPGGDPLTRAQALAAIAPLAVALAPAARVNAVVPAPAAAAADVAAAVAWLEGARSTTGQVIEVSAPAASGRTAPARR